MGGQLNLLSLMNLVKRGSQRLDLARRLLVTHLVIIAVTHSSWILVVACRQVIIIAIHVFLRLQFSIMMLQIFMRAFHYQALHIGLMIYSSSRAAVQVISISSMHLRRFLIMPRLRLITWVVMEMLMIQRNVQIMHKFVVQPRLVVSSTHQQMAILR